MPDIKGRKEILEIYVKNVPTGVDVNIETLARVTSGFSGADLANLVNEAAIFAARSDKKMVEMVDFEEAKDKIVMGAARRGTMLSMTEEEKTLTAYHEAGHAITQLAMEGTDPVHKVTIVPRGSALGVTMTMPERDQYGYDREKFKKRLVMALGGRLAEELFLKRMSTGASSDIQMVTSLARAMVTEYGMSSLGPIRYAGEMGGVFLGRSMAQGSTEGWSEETRQLVDREVLAIVNKAYATAREILVYHQEQMHAMSKMLLERETIGTAECAEIMGTRLGAWKIDKTEMSVI
jgi:cell division protease FtsH